MSEPVTIKIGEQGVDFVKRYPTLVKTYQSLPGKVQDYQIDWDQRPRGIVKIDHGQHSVLIEDVMGIATDQSIDHRPYDDDGLAQFDITVSLTGPNGIPHDEAHLKTYAILRRILDAGWQQVIERSEPRLKGKARQDYMFATSNINGLDASYIPTFEEWMRIESHTPWTFYAEGLYLEATFTRSPDYIDPKKPGVYLLSFNLKTENEYFRAYAEPLKRAEWKSIVPGELIKVAKMRAEKEAELRAKGISIDETYQDPPVPNLK